MRKSAGDWGVSVMIRLDVAGGRGDEDEGEVEDEEEVGEWKWNEGGKRVMIVWWSLALVLFGEV